MYIPKHFEVTDQDTLFNFVDHNSFATLVSSVDGSPFATHLPLLLEREENMLLGHVAMGNKQWRSFDGNKEALAIFMGPHAYISPAWYEASPAVPTWNYATVHIYGRPKVVEDEDWLSTLVDRLTTIYDPDYATGTALPEDFKARLLKGIVGFTMNIERIEGKFKLGQNRSPEDVLGVVQNLDTSGDPLAQSLSSFTREHVISNGQTPLVVEHE